MRVLVLSTSFTLIFLLYSNLINIPEAFAHQTKTFGGIAIEVGWANEPSLAGQMNTVTVGISNATNSNPVPNAVGQLEATVKKGSETKPLDLLPQEEEGLYGAQLIPGQIGQYELELKGTVSGQTINGSIPLDDVADAKTLTFPATTGSDSQVTSSITNQISSAVADLSTQVENAQTSADQARQAAQNASQSAQSIKASADGAYMFATIGVGIGIAGIALAVIALSRKERIEGEKIRRF
jgi:hypothetical protein